MTRLTVTEQHDDQGDLLYGFTLIGTTHSRRAIDVLAVVADAKTVWTRDDLPELADQERDRIDAGEQHYDRPDEVPPDDQEQDDARREYVERDATELGIDLPEQTPLQRLAAVAVAIDLDAIDRDVDDALAGQIPEPLTIIPDDSCKVARCPDSGCPTRGRYARLCPTHRAEKVERERAERAAAVEQLRDNFGTMLAHNLEGAV